MDSCVVIRPGAQYDGKQRLTYFEGISKESAGSTGLCLHLLTIPPGGRAKAHLHANHESAIYVISGSSEVWHGEWLKNRDMVRAGEFFYIPAGVPHLPVNPTDEPVTAIVARTDPNEQESVVLLPELDSVPDQANG
jgi:uncharacterized RmlC-like cupin family protein